jgi:hypothetical protein
MMRPFCCPARSSGMKAWLVVTAPIKLTSNTSLRHSSHTKLGIYAQCEGLAGGDGTHEVDLRYIHVQQECSGDVIVYGLGCFNCNIGWW